MNDRSELLKTANEFGLEFKKNISSKKLIILIAEAKGEVIPIVEIVPNGPKVKKEDSDKPAVTSSVHNNIRKGIIERKKAALALSVVTITNKDNRENDVMTTVQLSMENQHFSISKIVPLDIPVELEACLIKIAAGTNITLHKDEIVNGQRTGNKVPTTVKKFAISYARQ